MQNMPGLGVVGLAVLVVNLSFGFLRAGVQKLSFPWFLAVHAPVPLVVVLRVLSGLGRHLSTASALASAFFAGQVLGGRLGHWWKGA